MDNSTAERVSTVLKALAHPVRLKIVAMLEDNEMCVSDIVEGVDGKQSITSQQLNMMKDKGVLNCRKVGNHVYYSIANPNVIQLLHCVYRNCKSNSENLESERTENDRPE